MIRLISILVFTFFSLLLQAGIHEYADHSVLRDGHIVKIRVSETGVHCLPYDSLKKWGLQPEKVRVLGYGGNMLSENFTLSKWDDVPSVPFYMHKGSDGVFGKGDYLLFYAQGAVSWSYYANRWRHVQNPYSQYGYYFLSDSAGEQKQITIAEPLNGEGAYEVDWYTRYMVHERDSVNLIDKSGSSGGGREFYGERLSSSNNFIDFSFATPDILTDRSASCFVDVAAISTDPSRFTVTIGTAQKSMNVGPIKVSDFYTRAVRDSVTLVTNSAKNNTLTVKLAFSSTSVSAEGYLNYIELMAPCSLVMRDKEMAIANTVYLSQKNNTCFMLSNAPATTQIWRVTDGVNIQQVPTERKEKQLTWVGANSNVEKYVAVDVAAKGWKIPRYVEEVRNQDLHRLRNIDYVIICPEEFKEPAIRLAKKHEEIDHLTWAVVTDKEVYNEFSSGTPDVSAYRWLMKMLFDRANGNEEERPKYLLLMGNASYDNRNLLGDRSGVSKLLVYEAYNSVDETKAYATDDYCGFMADNAGIDTRGIFNDVYGKMDIAVGRLPIRTFEQATQVVDKLCAYMDNSNHGKWKSQICFLADDGDHGLHVQTAEAGAEKISRNNPDFVVNKIYLDAHTQEVNAAGESYPLAKSQFDNMLNNGVLFMDYSGHGGYNNITSELLMRTRDIKNMSNQNMAFWFLATCSFAHFDANIPSAAEEAILNPNGGSIGVVSACRTVYATQNTIINKHFCDTLFGYKNIYSYTTTLGDATKAAKNMTGRDSNKMAYVLLGDPALRLNFPTDYQIRTTTKLDTLHALNVQTIKGYVMAENGDTASWFNGQLYVTIWDKMQQISTRDNDEPDEANKVKILFDDYPNILFSGQANIVDGKFEYTFMVPKDIRYNYGAGRIAYYAYDTESGEEGIGHFENFVIGGSSTVEIVDTIGPDIQLYLNNPAFVDGGKTYEHPHFYANIYDANGINTVGSGIGHDLLLMLDDDPQQTYVLNDYFMAQNNSYQQGLVSYKMPEMTEGLHSLTFRAWDLLNNSSTSKLNFQVVKGLDPQIYQALAYPNPVSATGVLNFYIEYDQPDEVIQTEIYLYCMNGQLVKMHTQKGADGIQWNMSSMNVSPGIYIYQVKIKTPTSDYVSRAGKIIVSH